MIVDTFVCYQNKQELAFNQFFFLPGFDMVSSVLLVVELPRKSPTIELNKIAIWHLIFLSVIERVRIRSLFTHKKWAPAAHKL